MARFLSGHYCRLGNFDSAPPQNGLMANSGTGSIDPIDPKPEFVPADSTDHRNTEPYEKIESEALFW